MSEIRNTTTIQEIEVPSREPLISLANVITAAAWLTCQSTRVAVKGVTTGTVLAYRGGKALASVINETRKSSLSLPEINRLVTESANAHEAITALAAYPGLEIPRQYSQTLSAKLRTLVASNDKNGVEALARGLVVGRQKRLQANLIPLVAEACKAIGFTPQTIDLENGIIIAQGKGRQKAVIEVAKCKDGGVQLHSDTDGFERGACIEGFHEPLGKELKARGVHYELAERRRKPSRPVIDRPRVARGINIRCW